MCTNLVCTTYWHVEQDGLKLNGAAVETEFVITVLFLGYYSAVLKGTSGILSSILMTWGLRLFSSFLWVEVTSAGWELPVHMVNTFPFVLSGVYVVVKLSDTSSTILTCSAIDLPFATRRQV